MLLPFEVPEEFNLMQSVEAVTRVRWNAFADEIKLVALFRPDFIPTQLIKPMLTLWGLENLYTDLFSDDFLRRVYSQAHNLNKFRGTQESLNIFRDATNIGYVFDIVRGGDGSPESIDFWIANPPGVALDPQQIEYAVQGYESLLPQKVSINRPVGIITSISSEPQVVNLYTQIDYYTISNF